MNVLVAIDPGAGGGIAVLHGETLEVFKNPETPHDLCLLLERFRKIALTAPSAAAFSTTEQAAMVPMKCYVERVTGFIGGDNSEAHPASRMFNFGENYGILQGILIGLKIPFEKVQASSWQKSLGIPPMGRRKFELRPGMTQTEIQSERAQISMANAKRKTAHKNQLKALAQQLFPFIVDKITLATADALLILEYARRRERVESAKPPQGQLPL